MIVTSARLDADVFQQRGGEATWIELEHIAGDAPYEPREPPRLVPLRSDQRHRLTFRFRHPLRLRRCRSSSHRWFHPWRFRRCSRPTPRSSRHSRSRADH